MSRFPQHLQLLVSLVGTLAMTGAAWGQAKTKDVAAAKPAPQPVGPVDVSGAIDDDAVEHFVSDREALLAEKRQRMMSSLNDILTRNPYYVGKAGVLFRFAELEWEEARYRYFLERKKFEKAYEAFLDGTVKVQPPEPKPDYSDALKHYKQVLQEFPNYERLDEVMYYLGKGLISAAKEKEGASYFSRLIKQFPGSRYLPDAYFQVAEYYFNNDLLFAARTNYQETLKYKDSPLYQLALYKLGWVYYNLKEYRLALDTFKTVIAGVGMNTQEQRRVQFRNQALNDMLLNYAEIPEGWKEARDYYAKLGGEKMARGKLRKLAQKYVSDDKNEEAVAVWRYFLEQYRNEATAVAWYSSIIDSVKRLEDQKRLERVMRESVVFFDPKGTWAVVNRNNKAVYSQALTMAEDSLDFVATWYHQKAQKTEDRALYVQASKDYQEFLDRFPKSEKIYKVQFFLAEIYYFELQNWEDAADSYLRVVKLNPKDGEFLEDSAYGSVLAARNIMDPNAAKAAVQAALDSKRRKKKKKSRGPDIKARGKVEVYAQDRELKPTPLNKNEERFIEACESFRKWLPKSNYTPETMFYSASVLQTHDQLDRAVPQLETIVKYHPTHKYAAHAANSLFGANALLKRWPDVERWARFLIEKRNFKVKPKTELQKVIAIAMHQQSEDLQKAKKFKDAAEKMVALAREFPKHELAPKALFNAAAIHEKGKRTDLSVELYEDVLRLYGSHEVAPQALFIIGAINEARTDFKDAADRFEQMEKYKDHEMAADAIYNSGAIREALGDYEGSLRSFEKYLKFYKTRADAHEVYFHIAALRRKKDDLAGAKARYLEYIRKYPKQLVKIIEADMQLALLTTELKPTARAEIEGYLRKTISRFGRLKAEQKKGPAKAYAGRAQFMIAGWLFEDFMAFKLPSADKARAFKKAFKAKAGKLSATEKAFFKVLDFKAHEWSAAAATRVGQLYHRFSDAIYEVPVPAGLTEDETEMYKASLEDYSFPLQEKALSAYETAVGLAQKNQVYNQWSALAARELAALAPENFPLMGEKAVESTHQGEELLGGSALAEGRAPEPPRIEQPLAPPPAGGAPGQPAPADAPPAAGSGSGGELGDERVEGR